MIRNPGGLREPVLEKAKALEARVGARQGHELLVYCTFRPPEEQAILYGYGRTGDQIMSKVAELHKGGHVASAIALHGWSLPVPEQKKRTNAPPFFSLHQLGLAFDCVVLISGKPMWGNRTAEEKALWSWLGSLGESVGLEWAGRWKTFKESVHFQYKPPGFDITDYTR